MKTIKYILPLSLILLASSCEKEDLSSSVTGRVVTYGTNDPASTSPIKVVLVEGTAGGGLSAGERIIQSTMTDQNGDFSFQWEARSEDAPYWMRIDEMDTPPRHYDMNPSMGVTLQAGAHIKKNIALAVEAWIDFELEVGLDSIKLGERFIVDFGDASFSRSGPGTTGGVFKTRGNINKKYYTTYNKSDGSSVLGHGFLQTVAFDTVYHKIVFKPSTY